MTKCCHSPSVCLESTASYSPLFFSVSFLTMSLSFCTSLKIYVSFSPHLLSLSLSLSTCVFGCFHPSLEWALQHCNSRTRTQGPKILTRDLARKAKYILAAAVTVHHGRDGRVTSHRRGDIHAGNKSGEGEKSKWFSSQSFPGPMVMSLNLSLGKCIKVAPSWCLQNRAKKWEVFARCKDRPFNGWRLTFKPLFPNQFKLHFIMVFTQRQKSDLSWNLAISENLPKWQKIQRVQSGSHGHVLESKSG